MSDNRIGTCSLCGGPVVMPSMMVNPVASCKQCGATRKNPHGPVIPMERPRNTNTNLVAFAIAPTETRTGPGRLKETEQ